MEFKITSEQKTEISALVVLDYIVRSGKVYTVILKDNDQDLEEYLLWLVSKRYLKIVSGRYIVSSKGKEICTTLRRKNEDFIRRYDVLRSVDTHTGEFAFSSIFEYDKDPSPVTETSPWDDFLEDSRWHDLRLAAAEFHNIDLIEMLFVAFLSEGEFDTESEGWQFDLRVGEVFSRMQRIIDNRTSLSELGDSKEDQDEYISNVMKAANDVMKWIDQTESEDQEIEDIEDADEENYDDVEYEEYEYVEYEIVEEYWEFLKRSKPSKTKWQKLRLTKQQSTTLVYSKQRLRN